MEIFVKPPSSITVVMLPIKMSVNEVAVVKADEKGENRTDRIWVIGEKCVIDEDSVSAAMTDQKGVMGI